MPIEKKYVEDRPAMATQLRRDIKVEAGHVCGIARCGERIGLQIHHIDGNRENNSPENLIYLCTTHHTQAHNGDINRLEMQQYKRALQLGTSVISSADAVAFQHINGAVPESLAQAIRSTNFCGAFDRNLSDAIHAIENAWSSPRKNFDDKGMLAVSEALGAAAHNLSRNIARYSSPKGYSGTHYEVPKEYPPERREPECEQIQSAAEQFYGAYEAFIGTAIRKRLC